MMGGRRVVIHYCTQCQWMLRSAWLAQELLSTFMDDLEEVALRPGKGGVFEVWVGETCVWERRRDGGFPSAKDIKLKIRNQLFPEMPLGKHLENQTRQPVRPEQLASDPLSPDALSE